MYSDGADYFYEFGELLALVTPPTCLREVNVVPGNASTRLPSLLEFLSSIPAMQSVAPKRGLPILSCSLNACDVYGTNAFSYPILTDGSYAVM